MVGSRRSVRLILASALCASAVTLSACSAGQLTQTSEMVAAVPGVNVDLTTDTGTVSLRNLVIAYPGPKGYAKGSTAPLSVRIFNNTRDTVTLTGVSAGDAGKVVLTGGPVATPPVATATPSAPATPSATATPGATATPSGPATATAEPTKAPAGQATFKIKIAPGTYALLVPGNGSGYLQLTELADDLVPGESVALTFTFDHNLATEVSVPFDVPTTPPARATPDNPVSDPDAGEHATAE